MKDKVFYAMCIFPTSTITEGKDYIVYEDDGEKITVTNNNGSRITLMRHRFGEIQVKDNVSKSIDAKTVICKDSAKFKSISKSKEYKLNKETASYYYIINNLGHVARYGKKYFSVVNSNSVKKVVKKVEKAICIFPVLDELTFKEAYSFKLVEGGLINVKNDNKVSTNYIAKRFKIEMV